MLKKNTECEQKEPQLSKGKVSIGKDSKVKLSKEDQTIRAFLDSHNLSTIDSRYEKKLYNLFREKNKDTADCVGYCQYVYDYLHTSHKSVDAKLFFTVSLKPDVLIRFLNNKNVKNQKRSDYWDVWPDKCPVCGKNHFKNQPNGDCPLDMSKENSAETIEAAKKIYEKAQAEAIRTLDSFSRNLKKGVIS
ncbi:MAG: hypothetical protein J5710_14375 [Treponema sp.]|nr:hypothetical protein [Treponema sp.]MBR5645776.1 hypothetical protein [Treponema sp.]